MYQVLSPAAVVVLPILMVLVPILALMVVVEVAGHGGRTKKKKAIKKGLPGAQGMLTTSLGLFVVTRRRRH